MPLTAREIIRKIEAAGWRFLAKEVAIASLFTIRGRAW
jgi:hypothetical protein